MQNERNLKGVPLSRAAVRLIFTIPETGFEVESGVYASKRAAKKVVDGLDGRQILMKNGSILNVEETVVPEYATLN